MSVPLKQLVRLGGAPGACGIDDRLALADEQGVIESPGSLSKIGGHEQRLIADHDVLQQCFIGLRQFASEGLLVIKLERAVSKPEWPAGRLDRKSQRESFLRLQRNDQLIGIEAAGIER